MKKLGVKNGVRCVTKWCERWCVKDGVSKMVCDKVVCERWCDKVVCDKGASKMVLDNDGV